MLIPDKVAIVTAAGEGRKMRVMGNDVTLKLTRQETGGAYYLFELVTPPGVGIPPTSIKARMKYRGHRRRV